MKLICYTGRVEVDDELVDELNSLRMYMYVGVFGERVCLCFSCVCSVRDCVCKCVVGAIFECVRDYVLWKLEICVLFIFCVGVCV